MGTAQGLFINHRGVHTMSLSRKGPSRDEMAERWAEPISGSRTARWRFIIAALAVVVALTGMLAHARPSYASTNGYFHCNNVPPNSWCGPG